MITLRYRATLLDDISLPATPGRGDFLPGATLLGAVARDYQEAERQGLSWDLFHSGAVSFGDARLLDPHTLSPVIRAPLSLHHPKRAEAERDSECLFVDFAAIPPKDRLSVWSDRPANERQPELLKAQIGSSGWLMHAHRGYTLKTSIDLDTQRAKEGALFGHAYLRSGQRLGFTVLIDEAHPKASQLKEFVSKALARPVYLGKSRSAEFGGVRLEPLSEVSAEWLESEPLVSGASQARETFLGALKENPENTSERIMSYLLLSETCLFDDLTGQVTLTPSPAHFGLDGRFRLAEDYCFTRTVSWTPFNGYRRRPDVQRVALSAGSVVSFVAPAQAWSALEVGLHLKRIELGVGLFTAEGLGRARAAHPYLKDPHEINHRRRLSSKGVRRVNDAQGFPAPPAGLLASWMLRKNQEEAFQEEALSVALDLMRPTKEREEARASTSRKSKDQSELCLIELSQFTRNKGNLPTRSQWRNIEFEARTFIHKKDGLKLLKERLIDGASAVIVSGKAKERWRLEPLSKREAFSSDEIKRKAGPAVATLLAERTYREHYQGTLERLCALLAQGAVPPNTDLISVAIDRLAPLVLVHAARLIAAKLQDQEALQDKEAR